MTKFTYDFSASILREYDIRGIVDKTLSNTDLYAIGRAFGTLVVRAGGSKVGICYDGRHSSPRFVEELTKGLNDCGVDVENYGVGPTPMVYFAQYHRNLDGVLAVTGSHNPPEYNGIKMALRSGPVYGEIIQEMGRMAAKGDVVSGTGTVEQVDIYDAYIDRLAGDYNSYGKPDLKIAWDAGNGAAGAVLKRLTDKIPGTHILLFEEVDGNFPNHHPDPSVEKNLVDLKRAVAEHGCDLGIALDGDGDRIGAVDKNGDIIWPDQLLALYAKDVLTRHPGAPIILDVKCSQISVDLIESWGGKPLLYKVGHSLAKVKMKEINAPLAGELSGHIFFKDNFYGHDDALYCAVRLLNVVQEFGALHELKKMFPPVINTPEIRFDVPEENKFQYITNARDHISKNAGDDVSVNDIDGIRVTTPEGWWLLRASNTQNALTARVEAKSETALQKLLGMMTQTLDAIGCPYPEKLY